MDTNITPKISIMMCTYNRAEYLPEAIKSVLFQSFKDWELLILDDASTDNTEYIVSEFTHDPRIKYIKHGYNKGLGGNRVSGIEHANGDYIAILDSDDRWNNPNKLAEQNTFLDEHPKCGVVGSFAKVINENGADIDSFSFETSDKQIRKKMLARNQFVNSSTLFKKQAILKIGSYNPELAPAEDYDLFLRIGTQFEFANIPEYFTDYRQHNANSSGKQKIKHSLLHLEIIKKYKKQYPNYFPALVKAYARVLKSLIFKFK